ncbi:hypothetical protein TSTA_080810 [Talaromyces stipitatus ATCC 10500]|uniref:Uncharacterized protein n=1 Tax=Talaromyces stipitatus (strain ATCC 10500 / CBS 375.48 / QM 6759 / NRRL 1006) TaxID=441959 RepID=B8LZR6_TALSN|nr:uncharacterized protein TSTA_080810 [Talaromyces stipitatus ATCC 10500]EED20848.1 hypothetical protein TSTA_080810 [Talaromyces stipitatus ATCC 10500]
MSNINKDSISSKYIDQFTKLYKRGILELIRSPFFKVLFERKPQVLSFPAI